MRCKTYVRFDESPGAACHQCRPDRRVEGLGKSRLTRWYLKRNTTYEKRSNYGSSRVRRCRRVSKRSSMTMSFFHRRRGWLSCVPYRRNGETFERFACVLYGHCSVKKKFSMFLANDLDRLFLLNSSQQKESMPIRSALAAKIYMPD